MAEQDPDEGIGSMRWLLHPGTDEHDVPGAALHLGQDAIQEGLELERRCVLVDGNVQGLAAARDLPRGGGHLEIVGTPEAQSNMRRNAMRIRRISTQRKRKPDEGASRDDPSQGRRTQIPSHCNH